MVVLVSLEAVKDALRIAVRDDNGAVLPHEYDDLIEAYTLSVTDAVLRYLRKLENPDSWNENTVPAAVRLAIILGVNSLYDDESPELVSGLAASDPKNPLVALLCMMRKPTYA